MADAVPPLYVDMDGTLLRTDLLKECLAREVVGRPWALPRLALVALGGRPRLKADLAARQPVAVDRLPYHTAVIERLRAEQAAGRRLVLATAGDRRHAEAVAAHLGCFSEVLASEGNTNLKGRNKLAAIQAHAQGPFAYAGDATADLPIWAAAAEAWVVGGAGMAARVRGVNQRVEHLAVDSGGLRAWIRLLRPHQWAKNVLLAIPFCLAHRYGDGSGWLALALAFVAMSLAASGIYILNDLVDIERDRAHRSKHRRPFAAGTVPVLGGLGLAVALLATALTGAAVLLPGPFAAWLGIYLVTTIAYSARLKQVPLVDVIVLAGLYDLRLIAGAAAVDVAISQWLLALSMFLFVSLALCKRFTELAPLLAEHGDEARARGYRAADLPILESAGVGSGLIAILVLALFIHSGEVNRLYQAPWALWLICPVLLYWILRVWLKAARGAMPDDPVVFALKDRTSLAVGAVIVVLVYLAARNPLPALTWLVPGHG